MGAGLFDDQFDHAGLAGVAVGAISSGRIRGEYSDFAAAFVSPWLAPFPFAVGFFALAQFAFLAAVYLTVEARDEALREDFRLRALASAVAVGVMALAVFLLAENGAPVIRHPDPELVDLATANLGGLRGRRDLRAVGATIPRARFARPRK